MLGKCQEDLNSWFKWEKSLEIAIAKMDSNTIYIGGDLLFISP
jgi:hypothetical protein